MKKLVSLVLVMILIFTVVSAVADITVKVKDGVAVVKATRTGKILVAKDNEKHYYDAEKGEEVIIPLIFGKGKYIFEENIHLSGKKYKKGKRVSVKYSGDSKAALLQPSSIINYSEQSLAVIKAADLCAGKTPEQKVSKIKKWIKNNFAYDWIEAQNILSANKARENVDIDKVYSNRKGICYDLSVMVVAMLRSQGVPTRLEIGNGHAWAVAEVEGKDVRIDVVADMYKGNNYTYEAKEVF